MTIDPRTPSSPDHPDHPKFLDLLEAAADGLLDRETYALVRTGRLPENADEILAKLDLACEEGGGHDD